MRRLVIGDIHGCIDELQALLDAAGLGSDDEIIAIGDIVDRGPDTPRILSFFRSHPRARSIQGNHERKHARSFRGEVRPALSQTLVRAQIGEADYPAACDFMEALPRFLDLPEALLVHAFFEPGLPVEAQRENVIVGTLAGERHIEVRVTGPWYEAYDGPKPLVVGHRDYLGTGQPLVHRDRVFGIDTGSCRGARLTGLVLPEFRLVSVPSRRDYWGEAKALHRASVRAAANEGRSLTWDEARRFLGAATPSGDGRAAQVRELVALGEEAVARIHSHMTSAVAEALAGIASAKGDVPPRELPGLFAARIGKAHGLAPDLHRLRKGDFTIDALRARMGGPAGAVEKVRAMGLLPPAPEEEQSARGRALPPADDDAGDE